MPERRRAVENPRIAGALGHRSLVDVDADITDIPFVHDDEIPPLPDPLTPGAMTGWLRVVIPCMDPTSPYRRKLERVLRRQEFREARKAAGSAST